MNVKYLLYALISVVLAACNASQPSDKSTKKTTPTEVVAPPFCADSAYQYIVDQCNFGPRVPNSVAHTQCADFLVQKFAKMGLSVKEQRADLKSWDNVVLKARNIIASYRPNVQKRVLLCAHWDTRPWADADINQSNHKKPVMGANDGASGVAIMLEIARQCTIDSLEIGVDFVCFDAEDRGVPYWQEALAPADGSDWCLGSRHWAKEMAKQNYKAEFGILLDMVGGTDASFCYEGYSLRHARPIVAKIWSAAAQLGHKELFKQKDGGWATDDHIPVNEILGIPCADIIPYVENTHSSFGKTWHTVNDTPENISKQVLEAVGQTVMQVLRNTETQN